MKKGKQGFTLVELMIVLAIIAVVATLAIVNLTSSRKNANHKAAIKSLNALMTAQEEHRSETQTYVTLTNLTDKAGKARVPALSDSSRKDHGYTFSQIWVPTAGSYGFQGTPEIYTKTGDYTYVISDEGTIYYTDNSGSAITTWPSGWTEAQ
jgi:prepilin-type N-terminal cleavage/methylation domain-containing protein